MKVILNSNLHFVIVTRRLTNNADFCYHTLLYYVYNNNPSVYQKIIRYISHSQIKNIKCLTTRPYSIKESEGEVIGEEKKVKSYLPILTSFLMYHLMFSSNFVFNAISLLDETSSSKPNEGIKKKKALEKF